MVSLKNCKYLWLSIDIDCLDSVYFEPGETDVPCPGGLSPRELLYIVNRINNSGKLKVIELTQVNDLNLATPITVLSSRILEIALDIGQFRYGESLSFSHIRQLRTK
ncbi:MAG: arginase family protein [Waterburya sp.]